MSVADLVIYLLIAVAGTAMAMACVRFIWHAVGVYLIRRAGPRRLWATDHVLWRDPGVIERCDLAAGPGGPDGAPASPFRFVEEHLAGSQPCVSVLDRRGRRWRVKWGEEVRSENFAVRLAWACGYFAEVTYYVATGEIAGATALQRASTCLGVDGRFHEARFELDDPEVRKLFEEHSWAWNDNPFVGTRELQGLKILVMLLSNWDAKDRRDVARGSNTAIFEHRVSRWRREARYLITDWGGSMGRWGGNIVTRARWDPEGFVAQTPQFVTSVEEGFVRFGYAGQRTADMSADITVDQVRWIHGYLRRIGNRQLEDALEASGASTDETRQFGAALRERIAQLGRACGAISTGPSASASPAASRRPA
jgi:hypothetical protein